jgi:hypothetical protein
MLGKEVEMKFQRMKEVTKEEFDAFLASYPRPLERNVTTICEPPNINYNDWTVAPAWPESVVASYSVGDRPGDAPYYGPAKNYRILSRRDMVPGDI